MAAVLTTALSQLRHSVVVAAINWLILLSIVLSHIVATLIHSICSVVPSDLLITVWQIISHGIIDFIEYSKVRCSKSTACSVKTPGDDTARVAGSSSIVFCTLVESSESRTSEASSSGAEECIDDNAAEECVGYSASSPRSPLQVEDEYSSACDPFQLRYNGHLTEIGQGAYGKVYKGIHPVSGVQKAFKFVSCAVDPCFNRIRKEFDLARRLNQCSNVLAADELVINDEGTEACLILEICSGGDLWSYVCGRVEVLLTDQEAGGSQTWLNAGLPEAEALAIFSQMVAAIAGAHAAGVVHMDIKPANFMLRGLPKGWCEASTVAIPEASTLKLIDFGMAMDVLEDGERSSLGGTPPYMAPEVVAACLTGDAAAGGGIGLEADMWSLGVTLYELLSGCVPCEHVPVPPGCEKSNIPFLAAQPGGEACLRFEADEWMGVSEPVKDLVRRLMSFDTKERPTAADALEMVNALL